MFFLISSVCVCGRTPACCFPQWGPEGGLLGPVWQQLRWTQEVGEPEQDLARQNHMEHPGIYLRSYSHSVVIFTPFTEELFTAARCRFLFCKSFILTSLSSFPTDVFIKNYNVQYCCNSTTARQGFSSGNVWLLKTWWTQRVPIKSWWVRRSTEAHCKDKIKGWRHLNLEKWLKQYGFTSRYISIIWQLK